MHSKTLAITLSALAALGSTTTWAGEAEDKLSDAVKKLADAANYTWTSSTEISGAPMRLSPTTGKTEKGGFTHLATEAFDNSIEVVRKGTNGVIKIADEPWKSPSELPEPNFGGGMPDPASMGAMFGRRLMAARTPSDDIEAALKRMKPLKIESDGISGEFTEQGIQEYLKESRRGRRFSEPKNAKGTVRVWIKDGVLVKSVLDTEATMEGPQGEMTMQTITTTEVKDVGTTKVVVPEDAKKKLGS
jgi:hypothetical protein